ANEPFVVAHGELRFELFHGVEHNGYHDKEAGGRDTEGPDIGEETDEVGHDGNEAEEERTAPGNAGHDTHEVGLSRRAGANTGDKGALALKGLRHLLLLVLDHRVEEREDEDQ